MRRLLYYCLGALMLWAVGCASAPIQTALAIDGMTRTGRGFV